MKNSAWYHKLWRDKLDELPLKRDEDAAWIDMCNLLDKQLPINGTPFNKIMRYRIPALATLKVIFASIIISIIILPVALYIAKHDTVLSKKGNHAPIQVINNDKSPKHNESLNQHLKDIIISDSANHYSNSTTKNIIQNQKNSPNSFNNINKPAMVNQSIQHQNMVNLKANAKQRQTDGKTKNGRWLNTSSITLQPKPSKQRVIKGSNRHINIVANGDKQKNHHLLISGYSSSTGYTSTKASHNKAARNGSKTETDEAFITSANDINIKAIISNNINTETSKPAKLNNDKEAADTKIDPVKSPNNNTDGKEAKSSGSRNRAFNTSQKTVKSRDNKSNTKKSKTNDIPPKYNYGLEVGYNVGQDHSLYAGALGSYMVKPKWLINVGLRLNTYQTISGEYSHQSYYSPDSIPAFKISDSRKVMALAIPVTLEYKLSKNISLKAGPVLSMQIKQSGISTKLGAVPNIRDTVYHTRIIDSTLQKTTINKLNVGFTGGVSIQIKHFNIEGMYQVITPYKISSGLGSYQKSNQNFQIGIGYRFK